MDSTELPQRRGHFLLESGFHAERWLTLDALFAEPAALAPRVESLAHALRPYRPDAVCGPLLGGAFLAQAVATALGVGFAHTEPIDAGASVALFAAEYRLPSALIPHVRGRQVAVVDDVISAGSSVRASIATLADAGATTSVVGAFMILGDVGTRHFDDAGIPWVTLDRQSFATWTPELCPLCHAGVPLEDPRHRDV